MGEMGLEMGLISRVTGVRFPQTPLKSDGVIVTKWSRRRIYRGEMKNPAHRRGG
jgi:hypothetical protein